MGAINIQSGLYEYPLIASKEHKYKCPECERLVIFRKGKIKQPHFAHYRSENPCSYYDRPNEDQIHKDGKSLMRTLLTNKNNICFYRNCSSCRKQLQHYITLEHYTNSEAIEEYKFDHNNSNRRKADVALLKNGSMIFIVEIYHTNRTKEENRPEPWVEIDADKLITKINSNEIVNDNGYIHIECIRHYTCDSCIEIINRENERKVQELEAKRKLNIELARKHQEELEKKRQKQLEEEREYKIILEQRRLNQEKKKLLEREQKAKHMALINNIFNDLGYNVSEHEESTIKCDCDFKICNCSNPTYKLSKTNNHEFCSKCNNWKCRCKHI
jgi:competence CoiA-like predicted nuclease